MSKDRWQFIEDLDEELLKGGVILSEWCTFIVRSADLAFAGGANLAALITAIAGIETHLRAEHAGDAGMRFAALIDESSLKPALKEELHTLRKFRNRWVHVSGPCNDENLINDPGKHEAEIEAMAWRAIRALREAIYENPWL